MKETHLGPETRINKQNPTWSRYHSHWKEHTLTMDREPVLKSTILPWNQNQIIILWAWKQSQRNTLWSWKQSNERKPLVALKLEPKDQNRPVKETHIGPEISAKSVPDQLSIKPSNPWARKPINPWAENQSIPEHKIKSIWAFSSSRGSKPDQLSIWKYPWKALPLRNPVQALYLFSWQLPYPSWQSRHSPAFLLPKYTSWMSFR